MTPNRDMPKPDEYSDAVWHDTANCVPHRFAIMDMLLSLSGTEEVFMGIMERLRGKL